MSSMSTTSHFGYNPERVVSAHSDGLKCLICDRLLRHAVLSECGHLFCCCCIQRKTRLSQLQCPVSGCGEYITQNSWHADLSTRQQVDNMEFRCAAQKDCNFKGKLATIEEHESTCPFIEVLCRVRSCNARYPRGKAEQHHSRCQYVTEQCRACQLLVHRIHKAFHLNFRCPGRRSHGNRHNCQSSADQLQSDASTSSTWQETGSNNSSRPNSPTSDTDLSPSLQQQPRHQQASELHLQRANDRQQPQVEVVEVCLAIASHEHCITSQASTAEIVNNNISSLEKDKVTHCFGEETIESGRTADNVFIELTTVPRPSSPHVNGDISWIWRIEKFSEAQELVANGKSPVFTSQPFAVSDASYQLRARLYRHGNGPGKGSHMSAYVLFLKGGEYDAVLEWPFPYSLTFKLLSPGHRHEPQQAVAHNGCDVQQLLGNTCANSPGFGCQQFVNLSDVDISDFMSDDGDVFIEIIAMIGRA
eukprot:scpid73811/ scgid2818/ TNF receptor-associated factor 3; CAP-1; CD40 receptor-associated factor 1; CD40-binding protein; LMP1-associated protein 1